MSARLLYRQWIGLSLEPGKEEMERDTCECVLCIVLPIRIFLLDLLSILTALHCLDCLASPPGITIETGNITVFRDIPPTHCH